MVLTLAARCAIAQEIRTGEVAGRSVEMRVVAADDLSAAPWPHEPVTLQPATATVTPDVNIYLLLQAHGIAPDPGAFALVYHLNPNLKDLNALPPDTRLQIPSVAEGPGLQKLVRDRHLVELTVDPDVRRDLNRRIEDLQRLLPNIAPAIADANPRADLETLIGWFQQIERRFKRKTDPPLQRATLVEMGNEAELLDTILADALRQHRQLTGAEQRQIAAIYEDIKLEMNQYGQTMASAAPAAPSSYSITVNIKGTDSQLISGLRVYYTYNGLFRPLPAQPPVPSYGFTRLGSGQSEKLPMKNYQIWAAKDGDANHPYTPPFLLRIDPTSAGALTVELSLAAEGRQ
jgi:hypothetical protein